MHETLYALLCSARNDDTSTGCQCRGVHGNGEDWDPMGMGVRSAMGWAWDGNGN